MSAGGAKTLERRFITIDDLTDREAVGSLTSCLEGPCGCVGVWHRDPHQLPRDGQVSQPNVGKPSCRSDMPVHRQFQNQQETTSQLGVFSNTHKRKWPLFEVFTRVLAQRLAAGRLQRHHPIPFTSLSCRCRITKRGGRDVWSAQSVGPKASQTVETFGGFPSSRPPRRPMNDAIAAPSSGLWCGDPGNRNQRSVAAVQRR